MKPDLSRLVARVSAGTLAALACGCPGQKAAPASAQPSPASAACAAGTAPATSPAHACGGGSCGTKDAPQASCASPAKDGASACGATPAKPGTPPTGQ